MKKKLSLNQLKVHSFVTSATQKNGQTIKGGTQVEEEPIIIIATDRRFTLCPCGFTDNDNTCGHYYCPIEIGKGINEPIG